MNRKNRKEKEQNADVSKQSVFIRHRIRYWNLIAFCGWQNQRSSGIFTKTLPAIIPGSALSWLTTAKKTASAFMQI